MGLTVCWAVYSVCLKLTADQHRSDSNFIPMKSSEFEFKMIFDRRVRLSLLSIVYIIYYRLYYIEFAEVVP